MPLLMGHQKVNLIIISLSCLFALFWVMLALCRTENSQISLTKSQEPTVPTGLNQEHVSKETSCPFIGGFFFFEIWSVHGKVYILNCRARLKCTYVYNLHNYHPNQDIEYPSLQTIFSCLSHSKTHLHKVSTLTWIINIYTCLSLTSCMWNHKVYSCLSLVPFVPQTLFKIYPYCI